MKNTTIYLKAQKQVDLFNTPKVTVNDLADVYGDEAYVKSIESLVIMELDPPNKYYRKVISILDVIKIVHQHFPDIQLQSVGEIDTLIEYQPKPNKEKKWFTYLKVITICLILFCGSGVAIMTFQADASVPTVFANIHEIITGEYIERPLWLLIPYSIGLFTGVSVFFNHFFKRQLTKDPTPIQIEMYKYDCEVNECLIKVVTDEKQIEKQKEKSEE